MANSGGDIKFEMARYTEGATLVWKDLEKDFEGLRYARCEGLNSYGEPSNTYTEEFAESSKAEVFVGSVPAHKQTTIKLTLVFLEGNGGAEDGKDDTAYHSFLEFITGCKIAYRDTARKRKALMYLSGATEPKSDTLYGQKYKEVTFTFKNVYGMTFGYDDSFPSKENQLLLSEGVAILLVE